MDDGPSRNNKSFLESLKSEWSLLWHSLIDDADPADVSEAELNSKVANLTLEQVRTLSKGLSLERKHLNLKFEHLQKELELNHTKLESLKLVSGDIESVLKRIDELTDQGQAYADAMAKLDEQIRCVRDREQSLLGMDVPASGFRTT